MHIWLFRVLRRICVYMYMYLNTYACTSMYICMQSGRVTQNWDRMNVYVWVHASKGILCIYIYNYSATGILLYETSYVICANICTNMHACTSLYLYIHTYIHTYVHTYIHTYTCMGTRSVACMDTCKYEQCITSSICAATHARRQVRTRTHLIFMLYTIVPTEFFNNFSSYTNAPCKFACHIQSMNPRDTRKPGG